MNTATPDKINGMISGTWHELLDHQTCIQSVHCQRTSCLTLTKQSRLHCMQIALTRDCHRPATMTSIV